MASRIDRLGEGRSSTKFEPGRSGNPGGKVSIAKALEAIGTTSEEVRTRLFRIAIDGLDSAKQSHKEYCHTWLSDRLGLSKQNTLHVEASVVDSQLMALVEAAGMTPLERRKALADLEDDGSAVED